MILKLNFSLKLSGTKVEYHKNINHKTTLEKCWNLLILGVGVADNQQVIEQSNRTITKVFQNFSNIPPLRGG